jgi:hypothetical protein
MKWVGEDSFYAQMARQGRRIFNDDLFRGWYEEDNGRPCVPPSTLAIATLLQMHGKCSDEEAVARSRFDDRWKVALDLVDGEKPFAKSTLQLFRARLLLDRRAKTLFLRRSLEEAKLHGMMQDDELDVVLDTTPLTGRGAVKDTFYLLADGIKALSRAFSMATGEKLNAIVQRLKLSRYFADFPSLKGGAEIDWTNESERNDFLNTMVDDSRRLLAEALQAKDQATSDKQKAGIAKAAEILQRLIAQDTEPDSADPTKVKIKQGTAKDRMPSVTDPDVRHGRKSASKRFDGHKLALATEPKSKLVTDVDVLPGNAPDNQGSLEMVENVEENTGKKVKKTTGDCAYGDGRTRKAFADEDRTLVAKVPAPPSNQPFHKAHFDIDLEKGCVTCPAGQVSRKYKEVKSDQGPLVKRFFFELEVCQACPHKAECLRTKDKSGGRTVTLHPQEQLLQEARAYQKTEEFKTDTRARQRAEHTNSRLMQLGARQARYFGLAKTKVQAVLLATVLNLLLIFGQQLATAAVPTTTEPGPGAPVPGQGHSHADDDPAPGEASSTQSTGGQAVGARRPDGVRGAPGRGNPALAGKP